VGRIVLDMSRDTLHEQGPLANARGESRIS